MRGGDAGAYFLFYSRNYREAAERELMRCTVEWATMMDQHLLSAQRICASVNTSESARDLMQSVYVEGKTISMQLYKLLNDLKRIKGASANMNIYNIVLAIAQDNRLFTGGTVISVQGECRLIEEQPYIGLSTVNALLGVSNASTIMLNKQYLVYADAFLPFSTTGSSRGGILMLLEQSAISALARDTLPSVVGVCILRGGEALEPIAQQCGFANLLTFRRNFKAVMDMNPSDYRK